MKTFLQSQWRALTLAAVCVCLLAVIHLHAVSADVALSGFAQEVECDTTQRIMTKCAGYSILNKSTNSIWVDLSAGTVSTSNGGASIELATGTSIKLPAACSTFTFKTASGTSYLVCVAP